MLFVTVLLNSNAAYNNNNKHIFGGTYDHFRILSIIVLPDTWNYKFYVLLINILKKADPHITYPTVTQVYIFVHEIQKKQIWKFII